MHCIMIFAFYTILVSLPLSNTSNWNSVREVNYEDVLLYISFFGNLLLTGFHLFSKIISANKPQRDNFGEKLHFNVIAVDVSETFQLATQIVTLMILNHKKATVTRQATVRMCQCISFSFLANFACWLQYSFFFEIQTNETRWIVHWHSYICEDRETDGHILSFSIGDVLLQCLVSL